MNEIIIVENPVREPIIPMGDMPLGSIGRIVNSAYKDTIVRRTCSSTYFVVENLSIPGENLCWTVSNNDLPVVLLPNAKIIVQL